MSHARTLPRYVGLAGLVAGLLVAVPSLAASINIRDVKPVRATDSHIETSVYASYRHSANDPRYFQKLRVLVSRATLRRGALAALARGIPHPGLQAAALAAGFIIGNDNNILVSDSSKTAFDPESEDDWPVPPGYGYWEGGYQGDRHSRLQSAVQATLDKTYRDRLEFERFIRTPDQDGLEARAVYKCFYNTTSGTESSCTAITYYYRNHPDNPRPDLSGYEPTPVAGTAPATDQDLSKIDEHLPESIIDDFWSDTGSPYPESWSEANANNGVMPNIQSEGQAAPEIHQGVSEWAENMNAKLEDKPLPHPGTDTKPNANTATEQQLENQEAAQEAWEDPPPESAYPAMPTPSWNVKVIDDLPDYNASLGAGQCPEPDVIPVPGYGDITLDWQPACDLASGIRGAVIGICFIAALYIALGQSRSSES